MMAGSLRTDASSSIEKLAAWTLSRDPVYRADLVLRQAKLLVLDSIGCAFAALEAAEADEVVQLATELGGPPEATIIGGGKVSVLNAVLANGALVRVLDFNDIMFMQSEGHLVVGGHRSDNIPVALAIGEKCGSSGTDVLEAIIVGYELYGRLRGLTRYPCPFDGTSVSGFVAAAMAGRLMGLDAERQAHALALGACRCLAPRIVRKGKLSAAKSLANALIAQSGVQGALLAAKGITGPLEILDDQEVGLQMFFESSSIMESLWAPPPQRLEILDAHVKSFPCIGTAQTAVQAALELHRLLAGRSDKIERIEVYMADLPFVRDQQADIDRRIPKSREAADHSFTFLPAVALADGDLTLRQFDGERWNDPSIKRLMERVSLHVAPDLNERAPDSMPCRLRVVLRNGQELVTECLYPPGHSSQTGLDEDVVRAKFRSVSRAMLAPEICEQVIDAALGLDAVGSIRNLMSLVAGANTAERTASRSPKLREHATP
jgi:2-methylcitrate dehydratase